VKFGKYMSRIGRKPVKLIEGATFQVEGQKVTITGPKGTLSHTFRPEVKLVVDGNNVNVEKAMQTPKASAMHGLSRTLLSNMITGVTTGWNKGLEIVGVGYRAAMEGTTLVMNLGFSHQVRVTPPAGITFEVAENTKINVKGIDKQLVGEMAAKIRRVKPPEPYKGKGIRYVGEVVRRKAGKAAKATGAK